MKHDQECCEEVYIEDIVGDLDDLLNSPIIKISEETNIGDKNSDSSTWTFYTIATQKGHVTIRWFGSSNGYYSEKAYLYEMS